MKSSLPILFLLMLLGIVFTTSAQPFEIDWYTVDGGGGTSAGGQYEISGTIGQPDAGSASGGTYLLDGGFWAGVIALQTPGGPRLSIVPSGANVILSWPVPAAPFTLTSRTEVNTGNWILVPQTPVTNNGVISVTVPLAPGNQFFRLSTP